MASRLANSAAFNPRREKPAVVMGATSINKTFHVTALLCNDAQDWSLPPQRCRFGPVPAGRIVTVRCPPSASILRRSRYARARDEETLYLWLRRRHAGRLHSFALKVEDRSAVGCARAAGLAPQWLFQDCPQHRPRRGRHSLSP